MNKLYDDGVQKLTNELNVVKIVKNLRHLKILLKDTIINSDVKYQLEHAQKNIIYIDEQDENELNKIAISKENLTII